MTATSAVLPTHRPVRRWRAIAAILAGASLLAAALPALAQQAPAKRVLNINNWADYIGPGVIQNFQKETGIQVRYDATVESNETLHARLMAG